LGLNPNPSPKFGVPKLCIEKLGSEYDRYTFKVRKEDIDFNGHVSNPTCGARLGG